MNVRGLLVIGMLWLGLASGLHAQSFNQLWKKVEELEKKDLPKSVVEASQTIYSKAEREKNVPQMMKAFLTMMAYRNEISPDSLQVDIKKLEGWASDPQTKVPDKAVLSSILGEMIFSTGGKIPFEKADDWLKHSLKDSLALVDYDAGKWKPLVVSKETSIRYFDNNLYEMLARRAIYMWKTNGWRLSVEKAKENIRKTYQSLLDIYDRKGMREAWLLTALDAFPDANMATLKQWIKEYGDLDVCAEVYLLISQTGHAAFKPAERLALIREGIARYAHYDRINALKKEEQAILSPYLNLSVDYVYPNKPVVMEVNYRNLEGFNLLLYRVNLGVESSLLSKISPQTIAQYGTLLRQEHVSIPATSDYQYRKHNVKVDIGEAGIYYLVAEPNGHPNLQQGELLHLSSLLLVQRGIPKNHHEIVVLDKESGHPVPNAQVDFYIRKGEGYVLQEKFMADEEGLVKLHGMGNRSVYCRARTESDTAMSIQWERFMNTRKTVSQEVVESVRLFTDRAIYRPGQSLHYSGIVYNRLNDSLWVKSDAPRKVALFDPNGRKVAEQQVRTDDFGTFYGTFELPVSLIGGEFRIDAGKGVTTVRVEEYKRPTFEVVFDTIRNTYQAGDSIRVKGMARTFAGVPVPKAVVNYKVSCLENYFWRIGGRETNRVTGQTLTDEQGRFDIPVYMMPVETKKQQWFYTYKVEADVTSLAGETQSEVLDLPLGSSSLRVYAPDLGGKPLIKEHRDSLRFVVTNLKHVPVDVMVDYELYSVGENEGGDLDYIERLCAGKAKSNQPFVPDLIYGLPSGMYGLKALVKDNTGNISECSKTFELLSLECGKMPFESSAWCNQSNKEFDENGNATVWFGSSEKDVHLFYDVYSNDKWIERKRMVISDSLLAFPFKYKEEYGDGLSVSFFFAKHGKLYSKDMTIGKPRPRKSLQLSWSTFRDKLQPGSREKWMLNIKGVDGKPVDAQLMATLYDASLDQLKKHNWQMNLDIPRYIPKYFWYGTLYPRLYWRFSFPNKKLEYGPLAYSYMDMPNGNRKNRLYKSALTSSNKDEALEVKYAPVEAAMDNEREEFAWEEEASLDANKNSFRSNFAETAFFYPQLRTNIKGEVSIEFTLPESLTTWRFMGLAHTRNMDYGDLSASVVASKDFMLQPNMPRFVRVGDEVTLTASLMNLTEKNIKGKVRMELFNPETEKVWMVQKKAFRVVGKGTDTVQFSFKVKDEYEVLACRMIADGGKFSDGEQRYLPVLSDKRWMTESVSIDVDKAGTYRISLDDLFNQHSKTVSNPRMLVEFAGNPAWYAVQALPVLAEPKIENAYSWASAFYANTLAQYMVESNPKIRQVVESWRLQEKDALLSPLQKNEDLKDLLQEETPWLVEGMNETKQKQQLLTLFDTSALNDRNTKFVSKLKELQNEDGAWSWFKGMSGNRYMTTQIVELLARLQAMTSHVNKNPEMDAMYRKAFNYLKNQARTEYERMKEAENKKNMNLLPSEQVLRYLYICALDVTLQPESMVNDYYIEKLETQSAQFTIYGKSLVAIIHEQVGRTEKAEEFLQSVLEYSVVSEKMGRYFDTDKAPYSWFSYKIPTEVMALEAIVRLKNHEETIEQMKRWLLKQKQTQAWDMPIATVDAVYALLMTGKDGLEHTPSAELVLGEETITLSDQPALGYLNQEVKGDVMGMEDIVIHKDKDGMAWGAVYAQFLEKMETVKAYSNGLAVSRTLLKDGKSVSPEAMKVGDRITVRLTVTADRDMDFVQVKDERAACMEPVDVLSSYCWKNGMGYYQVTKDASTLFFFDQLRKGTHVLEYDVFIMATGEYQQGTASVQSVYAPEFGGHSDAQRMNVK